MIPGTSNTVEGAGRDIAASGQAIEGAVESYVKRRNQPIISQVPTGSQYTY